MNILHGRIDNLAVETYIVVKGDHNPWPFVGLHVGCEDAGASAARICGNKKAFAHQHHVQGGGACGYAVSTIACLKVR